ncbi:trigger factor [Candidatus Saccharibacteria bacterium]|nr:trigger factor [Candidatus Saccharibacteria bacterium]
MQVTRTDKSSTHVNLIISADQYDLTPIKNHVLGHFADKVKVPGFREGTAPAALVEKHVDQRALSDEFIEHALNQLYGKAIDQEKLRPAAKPEVQLKKFVPFTDLEFEAQLDVIGPIKLPDYKKIKLAKKPVEVTTADVNGVIKSLQRRLAERQPVERPAKDSDEVVIDFLGSDKDGKTIAGVEGKDYPLQLGSAEYQTVPGNGNFIPGFEENLIGVKPGDKKEFTITFPQDYGVATLQNKPVTFSVEVKKVSEVFEPKVDSEFAAKVGPFKTLAELKADIKKQLQIEKQQQAKQQYENELINKISDQSEVDVPKSLVEEQLDRGEEDEKRNLAYRGQSWQDHLNEEGVTEQEHRERKRPEAERRVQAGLVLSEIAEQENISITQEELDIRLHELRGRYQDPQMQAELDKSENQRQVASQLMTEKTVAKLVVYATSSK